jgi:hypothetical protein
LQASTYNVEKSKAPGACDMLKGATALLAITATLLVAALASSQEFGWFRGSAVVQNDPPPTSFIVARWRFGTNGAIGHMGWAHNYPYSEQHLNGFLERTTLLDVEPGSYRIVELGSKDVFDYPFAYVSEPGEMELTDQEVTNLRNFIELGGFILMDDFDGPWQWKQMRSQILRAFPDRDFVELSTDHSVFHSLFDLEDLQGMADHVPGGEITYFGLFDDDGNLAILAGHNNDLANFWEWYDQPHMPLKPAADAFRLGSNAIMHAITH